MARKTPDWLRGRRDACEERFSFLIAEFGHRRSLRRFHWGGFQLGYLGSGAGVLVEWYPRDGLMVWLLPLGSASDEALSALAGQLRSSGQRMLRGDYAQVPVIKELIRARAEALREGQPYVTPGGRPEDRPAV
jgi:hypothetical protein